LSPRDAAELLALAALWGASFLCMRLGAGEFGPLPLAAVRVAGAALLLMPLLAARGGLGELRRHWRPIVVVGLVNSALPFVCYGYAALSISAGLASIFNATSPLFSVLVAWAWLGERPTARRVAGLALGFGGVVGLALHAADDGAGLAAGGSAAAVGACLLATAGYGVTPGYTKRRLVGVAPLTVAAGSQLAAAAVLALPAAWSRPAVAPSPLAWLAAGVLAFACTGAAYLLYFRLFARIGPTNAIAVTFLIPAFAVLWAGLLLGETVTPAMMAGGVAILAGTALTTGLLGRRPT